MLVPPNYLLREWLRDTTGPMPIATTTLRNRRGRGSLRVKVTRFRGLLRRSSRLQARRSRTSRRKSNRPQVPRSRFRPRVSRSKSAFDLVSNSTCTSYTFSEDFSNYWTAVMYFRARNGTYKRVPQFSNIGLRAVGGITVYYIHPALRWENERDRLQGGVSHAHRGGRSPRQPTRSPDHIRCSGD
ncbi:hypothetical protein F5B18DRAFT_408057 [Nemania serpens]|nr:hypothetical protein F5B18DRAFT_408057 [Nemania serpens]